MLLSAIVESSDDSIVSKDLNGVITSWNKSAERIFGYTEAEAIGQSVTILIPADRMDEEADILRRIRAGERVDHFETIRRRKDGKLVDISLTISPIRDEQELFVYVLAPKDRYEVANYPTKYAPTNLNVDFKVKERMGEFYGALHDIYLQKHPGGYTCHYLRE